MAEAASCSKPPVRRKTSLKCTLKTKVAPHGTVSRKKSDSRPPKLLLGRANELQTFKLRRVGKIDIGESSPEPQGEHLHTPSTWKQKFYQQQKPFGLPISKSSPNLTTFTKLEMSSSKMSSQIGQDRDRPKGAKPALAKKPVISPKTPSPPVLNPSDPKARFAVKPPCKPASGDHPSGTRTPTLPPVLPVKPKCPEKPKTIRSPGTVGNQDKQVSQISNLGTKESKDQSLGEKSPESKASGTTFSKMIAKFENQSGSVVYGWASVKLPRCASPLQSDKSKSPTFLPEIPTATAGLPPNTDKTPRQYEDSYQTKTVDIPQGNDSIVNPVQDIDVSKSVSKSQATKGNRSSDSSAYDDLLISDGSDSESGRVQVTVTSGNRVIVQDCFLGDTDSGHGSTVSTDEAGIVAVHDGNGEGPWSEWVDDTPPSPTKLHPHRRQKSSTTVSSHRHSTDLSGRRTRRTAPKSRFLSNPERTISIVSTSPSEDYDDVILPGERCKDSESESEGSDVDRVHQPDQEEAISSPDANHTSPMDTVAEDAAVATLLPEPPPKPTRAPIDIPVLPPRRQTNRTSPYGSPKLSPRGSPYQRRESPRVSPRISPSGSPYTPRRKISLDSSIPAPLFPGVSRSRDGSSHSDNSGSSGDARPESPPPTLPRRRTGAAGDNKPAPALPARQRTTGPSERGAPPIPPRDQSSSLQGTVAPGKHESTPPPTPPRHVQVRPADLKPNTIVPLSPEAREAAQNEKKEQIKPCLPPPRRKTVDLLVPPNMPAITMARTQRSHSTAGLRNQDLSPVLSPCDNSMLGEVPPPPPHRARSRGDDYVGPDPPLPEAPPIPNNGYLSMNAVRPQVPAPRPPRTENYIDSSEVATIPPPRAADIPRTIDTPRPFELCSDANYLTILPAEEDEEGSAAFVVEQGSFKRFVDEPLYQIYHCGAVARDVLTQHHDDDDSQGEEVLYPDYEFQDDYSAGSDSPAIIYNTFEELANSTPSPAVMASKLQSLIKTSTGIRTLWCEMPEVRTSGVLATLTTEEKKFQEALFEVITSEASYLKSLNLLISHFKSSVAMQSALITQRDRQVLFSNVEAVRDVSEKFMNELEEIWQDNFVLDASLCDIITKYANGDFDVYVKYCSNLIYQERLLKELKTCNPGFCDALQRLESDSLCHSLPMQSFLSSPMQRITRFPLLVDNICHRVKHTNPYYRNVSEALQSLQKLVRQCNERAREMENLEKINKIDSSLDFKNVKKMALVSQGRSLVKSGGLTHLLKEAEGLLIKKKKETLNLYLFNDILIITKKKGEGVYQVIDYASRIHCHADFAEQEDVAKLLSHGLPTSCRHVFVMALLENHQKQPRDFYFACESESERMRWVEAVTPAQQVTDDERIYEEWACPQVQAIHRYVATEPDELTLEESDVVNVRRKMKDGWYEGERMRDGERGWFPANHTVEIQSERVRSRNLLQRYRLLTLHTIPTATGIS